MANIIQSNASKENIEVRVDGHSILQKSKAMMATSVAFGFKKFMYFGSALYNIKQFDLHKIDGFKTWKEYEDAIGLDHGEAHRYVGIGASIHARLIDEGKLKDGDPLLQKDVQALADENLEKLKDFGFRELVALSKRVDIFDSAMNGAELQKLLPGKREPTDVEQGNALRAKSGADDYAHHMRQIAEEYGWKYDAKADTFAHEDGTPLSDEEYGQIIPPSAAMHVFESVDRKATAALATVMDEIVDGMKGYIKYNKAIHNERIRKQAWDIRNDLQNKFQVVIGMLDEVIEGNEKRVKELHKHGLEEL